MQSTLKSLAVFLLFSLQSISALPTELDTRQSLPTSENGLSSPCKAITLIFARGTNEPGNVGDIAGPPWFAQLRTAVGTSLINVQGVEYSASVGGYLAGGDAAGSTEMLRLINLASTQCPTTKIVLGGYSQGAQLVHNSASQLSAAVTAQIAAVVVFGDPFNGRPVGNVATARVKSICHPQDIICTGSGGFTTHLTYGDDAATASSFVTGLV